MYNLTLVLKQKDYKVNCFAKRILRSAVSFEKYQTSSLGSSSAWFSCALQLVRFSGIPFYNSKSRWRYFCMKQKSCVHFLKLAPRTLLPILLKFWLSSSLPSEGTSQLRHSIFSHFCWCILHTPSSVWPDGCINSSIFCD